MAPAKISTPEVSGTCRPVTEEAPDPRFCRAPLAGRMTAPMWSTEKWTKYMPAPVTKTSTDEGQLETLGETSSPTKSISTKKVP